jgi:hypothetical protein
LYYCRGFTTSRVIVSTGYNITNNANTDANNPIAFTTNTNDNIIYNSSRRHNGDGGGDVCCICSHPLFARGFPSGCERMEIIEQQLQQQE